MKKVTYHHRDLRQALIDEALVLIREKGINQWSLREVSRRLGVSHTAPYRHFPDQQALLAAVAEEGFRQLHNQMLAGAGQSNLPADRLRGIGIAYVEYAIAHPSHYQVMFRSCPMPKYASLQAAGGQAFEVLLDTIISGQATGHFRPGNPLELALVAWSLVHGLAMLVIDGHLDLNFDIPALATFSGDILLNGLLKAPSPADD